jgi:hypothetical protein
MAKRRLSESGIQRKGVARKLAKNRSKHSGVVSKSNSRRFSIEIKDVKSGAIVLSTIVNWTSDERSIGLALIYRMVNEPTGGN